MLKTYGTEDIFELFFENSIDLLSIANTQGQFIKVNPEWEATLGYTINELEGKNYIDFVHPDDVDSTLLVTKLAENQKVSSFVNRYCHKNGSYRWIEWRSFPSQGLIFASARDITNKKNIEEDLKNSQKQYKTLIETQSDLICRYLPDTTLTFVNDAFCRFFGKRQDELIGGTFLSTLSSAQRELFQKETLQLVTDGESSIGEYVNLRYDGAECWIQWAVQSIRDENKNVIELLAVGRDLTKQKEIEKALRESERKYRLLFENMTSGFALHQMLYDENGKPVDYKYLEANPAFEKLTGLPIKSIIGKSIKEILPSIEEYWIQTFGKVALTGQPTSYINFAKDLGKYYDTYVFCPEKDKYAVVFNDVTDRIIAEQKLKENESKLKKAQFIGNIGYTEQLIGSDKIWASAEAMKIYGLPQEDGYIEFNQFKACIGDFGDYQNSYLEFFEKGKKFDKEFAINPIDGSSQRYIREIIELERDNKGNPLKIFTILIDITDLKKVEEALQKRVLALTKPIDDPEGINFTDLFEIEAIQKLQDTFAEATGVASLITLPDGTPITKPSNFCRLCTIIRSTKKGAHNCFKSDAFLGKENPYGPNIQPCLSGGLWDAGASISLEGKHIANWLIGQVKNEVQDENQMMKYAEEIGVNSEIFRQALVEVPSMSRKQFDKIANSLYVLANELSLKAFQNVQQARFISEQKQVEEALRTSEAQFKGMAQNIPGMVFQFYADKTGKLGLKYVSDLSKLYFGLDNSNLEDIFNRFAECIIEEERSDFLESIQEAIEKVKPWNWKGRFIRPDNGKDVYFHGISQPRFLGTELIFDGVILDVTESKIAEKELDYTRAMLSTAFMQSPIPMVIISSPDYVIRLTNEACREVLGIVDEPSITGSSLRDIKPSWQDLDASGNVISISETPLVLALKGIETKNQEYLIKRKDGTIRYTSASSSSVRDRNGNIIAAYLIFPDITEQKVIETKFRELAGMQQVILDTITAGLTFVKDRKQIWVNSAFCRIFGYSVEEIIGTATSTFYANFSDYEKVGSEGYTILANGGVYNLEVQMVRKDGQSVWIYISGKAINSKRLEEGSIWMLQDITNRKEAEEKIKQFAELHQTVLDTVNVCLLYVKNRQVQWVNNAFYTIYGYELSEVINKDTSILYYTEDDYKEVGGEVYKLLKKGLVASKEVLGKKKNGSPFWVNLSGKAIDPDKPMEGSIWMIQDISDRKDSEIAIKMSESILKSTMESINDGLLVVSAEGVITHKNSGFCKIFKLPDELVSSNNDAVLLNYAKNQLIDPEAFVNQVVEIYKSDKQTEDVLKFKDDRFIERSSFPLSEDSPLKGRVWLFRDITEKRKTEEFILKNQKLLTESQRVAKMGTWELNVSDSSLFWNEESYAIFGYRYHEVEPNLELFLSLIHPKYVEKARNYFYETIQTKHFNEFECEIIHRKGELRTILISGEIVFDSSNEPIKMFGIVQDITERKISEKKLEETRERLQAFMDSATDAFSIWDKNLNLVDLNKTALKYLSVANKNNALGVNLKTFVRNLKNKSMQRFHNVIETGLPYYGIDEYVTKKHSLLWLNSRVFKVEEGIGIVTSDITEQKKSEEILKEKDAKLRSIYKAVPVGLGLSVNRVFHECNDAFLQMVGYSADELIGKNARILYNTKEDFDYIGLKLASQNQTQTFEPIETKWIRKDKKIINVLLSFIPIDSSDYSKGTSYSVIDITDRKQVEEEIKNLNIQLEARVMERTEQLEQANKELEAFAYSISHDLRAPLRHIDGFIRLLFSNINQPNDNLIGYYDKIVVATQRMSAMIDDLLAFSRLGRKELITKNVNLNDLIKEIIDQLKPDIVQRSINWKIQTLPSILADPSLLKIAFENIISNAIKYTSKKSHAIIEIGYNVKNDNYIELYFKDNGSGFDMNYVHKLFNVFQRLHTSEEFEGTGIGLANVKQIVNKHKGYIRAESKLDEGSTFYIQLPK